MPFSVGQAAAGTRVSALRRVWSSRCLRDIFSAAIAFVDKAALGQAKDHVVVTLWVLGLEFHRAVPRQTERGEIVELSGGDVGVGAVVEILDPHQKPTAGGAGEQPRQHRRAQVADVQISRWAGSKPAGGHARNLTNRAPTGEGRQE